MFTLPLNKFLCSDNNFNDMHTSRHAMLSAVNFNQVASLKCNLCFCLSFTTNFKILKWTANRLACLILQLVFTWWMLTLALVCWQFISHSFFLLSPFLQLKTSSFLTQTLKAKFLVLNFFTRLKAGFLTEENTIFCNLCVTP